MARTCPFVCLSSLLKPCYYGPSFSLCLTEHGKCANVTCSNYLCKYYGNADELAFFAHLNLSSSLSDDEQPDPFVGPELIHENRSSSSTGEHWASLFSGAPECSVLDDALAVLDCEDSPDTSAQKKAQEILRLNGY